MRSAISLALAALCLAPAFGASAEETPAAKCAALASNFPQLEQTSRTEVTDIKDGCQILDATFNFGTYVRWHVAELKITGRGLTEAVAAQRLPEDLNLTLTGLRFAPNVGGQTSNYILEIQQVPFDAHLAYQWNAETKTLSLDDLSISGQRIGLASVSARVSGLAEMPREVGTIADFANAGIENVTLTLNNYGVFQSMLAPPLIGLLPPDEDPRPTIANYQAMLTTSLAALPETVANAASKAVLTQLIADFPAPTGIYQLSIDAQKPVPISSLTGNEVAALTSLVSSLVLTATHQPPSPRFTTP